MVFITDEREKMTVQVEEKKPETDLVFVYGSLKQGFQLNHLLRNAQFIGEGVTKKGKFEMFTPNDHWPAVVQGKYRIKGEVYKVTPEIIERLDQAEGVPHLYERKLVKLKSLAPLCYFYIAGDRLANISNRLDYKSPRIVTDRRYNTQEWVHAQH